MTTVVMDYCGVEGLLNEELVWHLPWGCAKPFFIVFCIRRSSAMLGCCCTSTGLVWPPEGICSFMAMRLLMAYDLGL